MQAQQRTVKVEETLLMPDQFFNKTFFNKP